MRNDLTIEQQGRVRQFREMVAQAKKLGLRQSDIAREIDMSPNTVSRWMNGVQPPDGAVLAYMRLRLRVANLAKGVEK